MARVRPLTCLESPSHASATGPPTESYTREMPHRTAAAIRSPDTTILMPLAEITGQE